MARIDLEAELAALPGMTSAQLRERWSELTGRVVPRVSPKLLRLALAWELQAAVHGGLSRRTSQKLAQLAAAKTVTRDVQPGMRLAREWNGKVHVVLVGEDGVVRWAAARGGARPSRTMRPCLPTSWTARSRWPRAPSATANPIRVSAA